MKENRQLNNNDLYDVNGGYAGYCKYPKAVYHAAGFCILDQYLQSDEFYLRVDGLAGTSPPMREKEANVYVDYYLSHTNEEYVKFIQKEFPSCPTIYPGYDIKS